jgi:hypothetical protein
VTYVLLKRCIFTFLSTNQSAKAYVFAYIMSNNGDELFFHHVTDTSSDDDSDDDSELLMTTTLLIHDHNVAQIPRPSGSIKRCVEALDHKREDGHVQVQPLGDYYHYTNPHYTHAMFQHRFQMSRPSFQRIMDGIKIYDDYFAKRMSLAR